jgi:tagatose-1,6-bisphosphate aldolase
MWDSKKHLRFLWGRKQKKSIPRPGTLSPEKVKKIINEIGKNKKVNIQRVHYDGALNDPIAIKIVDIRSEYFTGNVVNVERSIRQDINEKTVYVKGGGGIIEFYFEDGDIASIEEDLDEQIIEQKNIEDILLILEALDLNEEILISYYDHGKGGMINGVGRLLEKDLSNRTFKVELALINDIELDEPITISLNLQKDTVLDLEVVL